MVIARSLAETPDRHQDVALRLRTLLKTEVNQERRFRAACALARLAPSDWEQKWSDEIARGLVQEPYSDALMRALLVRGVRVTLIQSLRDLIVESGRPESERSLAAVLMLH